MRINLTTNATMSHNTTNTNNTGLLNPALVADSFINEEETNESVKFMSDGDSEESLKDRVAYLLETVDDAAWARSKDVSIVKVILALTPYDTKRQEPHPATKSFVLKFYVDVRDLYNTDVLRKRVQMTPDHARYFARSQDITLHASVHAIIENSTRQRLHLARMSKLAEWNAEELVVEQEDYDEPSWTVRLERTKKGTLTGVELKWPQGGEQKLNKSLDREAKDSQLTFVRSLVNSATSSGKF